ADVVTKEETKTETKDTKTEAKHDDIVANKDTKADSTKAKADTKAVAGRRSIVGRILERMTPFDYFVVVSGVVAILFCWGLGLYVGVDAYDYIASIGIADQCLDENGDFIELSDTGFRYWQLYDRYSRCEYVRFGSRSHWLIDGVVRASKLTKQQIREFTARRGG
ncbi:MAG: hypothetical protein LBQ99_00120, partial [Endomicrobium sp.]|nr:hypothetical protein [Endomicrobium sp.]